MEVGKFSYCSLRKQLMACSIVEVAVVSLLAAQKSLACLLMLTGTLLNDIDGLPNLVEKRFPMDDLHRLEKPGLENNDAGDPEDNDEGEDEDDDQDDDDAGDEDFSGGEEGGDDEEEVDPEDDPEANGNEGSDDEDDDDDDDGDDDEDGEDDEEDEEEEEDQPPAKKRK
ncbi:Hypothetical predicted protein [Olea europaea subsp. europaea]|uniref:Uncharacterized protein n=1 Tax=Olea europaea subsp. europaea TaxID=158383 RepID=A0A8S0Q8B3_OLEEU|nr:Hypothetical predicted protein [Olea europaea subsp. europaea]